MKGESFNTYLVVDNTAAEAFNAINNVRGWWTTNLEGSTQHLHDEFEVRFGDIHYSKQKLVECEPNRKVTWLITESNLSFLKDPAEWNGSKVIFDIASEDGKTKIHFTHEGLVPAIECYQDCSNAWNQYLRFSLNCLITKGKGQPGFPPAAPCD